MPHQAVITGTAGPGRAVVGTPIQNVTDLHINFNDKRITLLYDAGASFVSELELTNSTTITIANNAGNFTVTIA